MRLKNVIAVAVTAAIVAIPSNASAAVLVNAPSPRAVCGDAIQVGIWAQPWTTAPRTVRITAIDQETGIVWWTRTATASAGAWRDWYLPSGRSGQCGTTTINYRGRYSSGRTWTERFTVRFRSEGV